MVKRKKYFLNPIRRQNFAYAFAETPNLNLEVRQTLCKGPETATQWKSESVTNYLLARVLPQRASEVGAGDASKKKGAKKQHEIVSFCGYQKFLNFILYF